MTLPFSEGLLQLSTLFKDRFLTQEQAEKKYSANTLGIHRPLAGAVMPLTTEEIVATVKIANLSGIGLYPISTGHNWGYGGATPTADNCLIIDLSNLKQILMVDAALGLITVQPGVTQGQLQQFLTDNKLPFIVPVTGAGPNCSLLGNALDRGYGLTPQIDHFFALTALEAVLPTGEIYHGTLDELGGKLINKAFKWGLGPYLEGLFAQGNLGIVTVGTIALATKPECTESFFFTLTHDSDLPPLVAQIRKIYQILGSNIGSIKITNQHRILEIMQHFPEKRRQNNLLNDPEIIKWFAHHPAGQWFGSSVLMGNKRLIKACKKVLKQYLKPHTQKLFFFKSTTFQRLNTFIHQLPVIKKLKMAQSINQLAKFVTLLSGSPSEVALPLAYFKNRTLPVTMENLNPDQDGCGLIWFSPLVPMKTTDVAQYLSIVKNTCAQFDIEPVITLSTISERCIDSAVPILFDRENPLSVIKAHDCYTALFKNCQQQGYIPYRIPANFMSLITNEDQISWQCINKIKQALDPNHIISPGRYSLIRKSNVF